LASLPPDVDVPLPLGFALVELPVVAPVFGEADGVAELAAGSPDIEPRPLGAPCAWAKVPEKARKAESKITVYFMGRALSVDPR
jgi:hypothetical protein